MEKFKGKFQEACCVNRGGRRTKYFEEYDAGYDWWRHCSCHICQLRREEENIEQCIDNSCDGCKNMASGKKMRSWIDDTMKGI